MFAPGHSLSLRGVCTRVKCQHRLQAYLPLSVWAISGDSGAGNDWQRGVGGGWARKQTTRLPFAIAGT